MDMLNMIWDQIAVVFGSTFLGMTIFQLASGSIIMLLFLVLRKIFARIVISKLRKITKNTKTDIDDKILDALEGPLKVLPIIAGIFFFVSYFSLPDNVVDVLLSLTRSMIALIIFWSVYNILKPFTNILEKFLAALTQESETLYAEEFTGLIIKGLKIVIIGIGVIIILSQWGVNVLPLLGGLGIAGMAMAFAAQDLISNVFNGIKLLLDGTYKRGDWIKAGDIEGTVEQIGIATTKIRRFDKSVESVPNRLLGETSIINFSKMTNRRVKMTIGVEYRTTVLQIRNVVSRIRTYLEEHPQIAQPGESKVSQMVHVTKFDDSSININLYYFTKTTKWAEWRMVRDENMMEFMKIMEEEGVGFAFPSVSNYVEVLPEIGRKMASQRENEEIEEAYDWSKVEGANEEGSG